MIPQYLGTCRVQLILERDTVRWGETVTGSVVLLGGTRDQRVLRVEAYLAASGSGDDGPCILANTVPWFWSNLKVPEGEKIELAFRQTVPMNTYLGRDGFFMVRVELPAIWERETFRVSLAFEPSLPYVQLADTAAQQSGLVVASWRRLQMGDGVGVSLRPSPRAQNELRGLELEIFNDHSTFHGEMTVDPRGKSVVGTVRSIAGLERSRYRFNFTRPDSPEVSARFAQILRPFIDPHRNFPLPSQAPAKGAAPDLPLPAVRVERGSRDFPRPADELDMGCGH